MASKKMRKLFKIGAVVAGVAGVAVGAGAIGTAIAKARELKKQQASVLKAVQVKKTVSLKGSSEGIIAPESTMATAGVGGGGMFQGKNLIIIAVIAVAAGYFLFLRKR